MSGSASRPDAIPFVPAAGRPAEATIFQCALCGAKFTHGVLVCADCPLHAGCDVVKCPECGYQTPRTSRLVEWTKALSRKVRGGAR